MLAGGMVIAAPSMVPEAAAAGALYVSAENAMFDNTFGGASIIEVIVIDPNRSRTDISQGEPVVKVDENQLRMAQAVDGNWYGYFGDETKVENATTASNNLTFGTKNQKTQASAALVKGDFSEAKDVVVASNVNGDDPANSTPGAISNAPVLSAWNGTGPGTGSHAIGFGTNSSKGQIGIPSDNDWPLIQLYTLTSSTGTYSFDVVYEQAGANEVVSLTYTSDDLDDYAGMVLDRTGASQESDVHLTITDNQLNIDPTAEDIVIFYVTSSSATSTMSFTNGTVPSVIAGDGGAGSYKAWSNTFDDNGKLVINYDANTIGTNVLINKATDDDAIADAYLVFYEYGENSGIFVNTDDNNESNLEVNILAKRGTTATFDYNDSAQSFIVTNDFGVINMDESSVGDEWNSGEEITVTLIDQDLNKNTLVDEDLLLVNTTQGHLVPSLQIGSPLMTNQADTYVTTNSSYSNIAWYDRTSMSGIGNTQNITITTGYTGTQITSMDTLNTYFNFDFTSFNSTKTVSKVCLVNGTAGSGEDVACGDAFEYKGIAKITSPAGQSGPMSVNVTETADGTTHNTLPFVADIFSFGTGANNAIYRLQLEESGVNTATFEGTVEYTMLNQLNINSDATYTTLDSISSSINIIVEQDMTDEDSPRVNYLDLGADGVNTQIADQQEAPTHNGVVSFDSENYKIADTVVVTLNDQDMNTDSELIDVYVTKSDDKVGDATTAGLVLDITFDDVNWNRVAWDSDCTAVTTSSSDGLAASGFTLVETDASSGIFTGSFQVPTNFCHSDDTTSGTDILTTDSTVGVTGLDMEVNYQDFRNASGESIEVGAGASINANTGSVAFDRTVYPVPYGNATGISQFKTHATDSATTGLAQGDVVVHVRVTDADYNVSASGEDTITDANVTIKIEMGLQGLASQVRGSGSEMGKWFFTPWKFHKG
jgi:hypothetical protein